MARAPTVLVASYAWFASLASALALSSACAPKAGTECQAGRDGCACLEGQCLGGWPCVDGTCQAPSDGTSDPMPATTDPAPSTTDTGADAGGPMITQFFADTQVLEPGATISFTATVSHPDGLSEIVGGTLEHAETASTYAAFDQTAGGTFTVSLSWDAIGGITPISGPRDGAWTLDAVFFDNAGESATATLDLMLACSGVDVCDGACVDWSTDAEHCGGCANACGPATACSQGTCAPAALSPCFYPDDMTCAVACGDLGQVCVQNGCNGATYAWYSNVDGCLADVDPLYAPGACDLPYTPPPDGDTDIPSAFIGVPEEAVRCCCS